MTPEMKVVLCNLAEQRLTQLTKESAELTGVLIELRSDESAQTIGSMLAKEFPNGVSAATVPLHKPTSANGPTGQLEDRLAALRVLHGPVFVIDPKNPVAAGQRIKWGKPDKPSTVEVLESAELPDREGKVVAGRHFAKLVDV